MSTEYKVILPRQKVKELLKEPMTIRKALMMSVATVLISMAVTEMFHDRGLYAKWAAAKQHEKLVEQLGPDMRRMAAEGKPEAIIWVAKHVDGEPMTADLEKLAAQGSGEAMEVLAAQHYDSGDQAGFLALMDRAAEVGNEVAFKFVKSQ